LRQQREQHDGPPEQPCEREQGEQRHHDRDHDPRHLRGEEAVDRVRTRFAGVHELHPNAVDVPDRREAPAQVGEPLQRGIDGALAQRVEKLLVADVLDLVALEPTERAAHD